MILKRYAEVTDLSGSEENLSDTSSIVGKAQLCV